MLGIRATHTYAHRHIKHRQLFPVSAQTQKQKVCVVATPKKKEKNTNKQYHKYIGTRYNAMYSKLANMWHVSSKER